MSLFDTLIVQPIFNLLVAVYGLIPGGDFGISLIIFTIVVRLLMWPLVKKQLHQTKVMRAIQPDLKKIKTQAKGNKQVEAQLMMELYRERGVNPFGAIGLLLVQLPIFFALFRVIQIITSERDKIGSYTYDFLERLGPIHQIITDPKHEFNESLLGIINLTHHALGQNGVQVSLILLAALAAGLQFWQSKQITPVPTEKKRLRDILSASAQGKQADQSEISAVMSQRMIMLFPFITFFVALYLPAALVLYYAASSAVAVIQQHIVLNRDVDEMETIADKKPTSAQKRAASATEATVVTTPPSKPKGKKRRKR